MNKSTSYQEVRQDQDEWKKIENDFLKEEDDLLQSDYKVKNEWRFLE